MNRLTIAAGLAALLGATAAQAAPGVVTEGVNLRAGPDVGYPLIEPLPPGTPVQIFGCLQGWSWCDIAVNDVRGWAAGPTLQVLYDNQPAYLPQYGADVGLPFIGFDEGDYWGHYYRNRPFYADRDRYHGGPGNFAGGPPGGDFRGGDFHGGPGHFGGDTRGGESRGGESRGGESRGGDAHGGPGPARPEPGRPAAPIARPGGVPVHGPERGPERPAAGRPGPAPGHPAPHPQGRPEDHPGHPPGG